MRWLVAAALTVLALSLATALLRGEFQQQGRGWIVRLFDMNREKNIPTWFASSLLLLCSALFALIGGTERSNGRRVLWWLIAAALLFVSIDESAAIHEHAAGDVKRVLLPGGMLSAVTVSLAGLVFASAAILALVFARGLPRWIGARLAIACVTFVAAAAGVDSLVEHFYALHAGTAGYTLLVHAEEVLELAAVLLTIDTLLREMARRVEGVQLRFMPPKTLTHAANDIVPAGRTSYSAGGQGKADRYQPVAGAAEQLPPVSIDQHRHHR